MIHVIADTHFGHRRIALPEYCSRPNGWEKTIVTNWQRLVMEKDYVVHLGDFALMTKEREKELCGSLFGDKILIKGNHDGGATRMLDVGFKRLVVPPDVVILNDRDMGRVAVAAVASTDDFYVEGEYDHVIFVSHYPIEEKLPENRDPGPYFYGHIHNDRSDTFITPDIEGRNMCVEVNEYRPWNLKELLGIGEKDADPADSGHSPGAP